MKFRSKPAWLRPATAAEVKAALKDKRQLKFSFIGKTKNRDEDKEARKADQGVRP